MQTLPIIVYGTIAGIYTLFAIATTLLFFHYRHDTGIRHRGAHLTILSAMVNIPLTIFLFAWTPMSLPIPGWVTMWLTSMLIPAWVLLSFNRFLRLVFLYRVSEAKLDAAEHGKFNQLSQVYENEPVSDKDDYTIRSYPTGGSSIVLRASDEMTPEQLLKRNWYHRNRKRISTRLYIQTVAIFMSLHIIVTIAISVYYAIERPGELDEPILEDHYSMLALEGMCSIWYGMLFFFLREQTKVRDAHGIYLECRVWVPFSLLFYFAFLAASWVFPPFEDPNTGYNWLPASLFAAIHFMIGHSIFVAWPAIRVAIQSRRRAQRRSSRSDQERRSFDMLLRDPRRFAKFKEFCVVDFSVENALFLERYRRFKELATANQQSSHNGGKKRLSFLMGGAATSDEQTTISDFGESTRLSDEAMRELKAIYTTFMAPGAEFEVNLTSACRQAVADRIRDGDATAETLDEAHAEIHQLVYQNTYTRYMSYKNKKRASRMSVFSNPSRMSQIIIQ
jgi:hypothetical protein